MAESSGDKTEEPTPKKLDDARKKGQVAKSRDLTSALVFIAGFAAIGASLPTAHGRVRSLFAEAFARVPAPSADPVTDVAAMLYSALAALAVMSLPVAVAAALVGGLGEFLQVGPLFAKDPLTPKLEKLNPIEGFKNLFSKKQIVELIKSTAKLTLAAYLAYTVLRDEVGLIVATARSGPGPIAQAVGHLIYELSKKTALLLIVVSLFDMWWQRKVYMKDMMMTKDEVKREYKESEGDPHIKGKRREMMQEISEGSEMADAATADAIVTNPDHVAVAIKYRKDEDQAPRVVAKGMDAKAEKIKRIAREAGVPILRNIPLAQALHKLDVGDEVPEELYDAVAEVLNFVFTLSKQK